MIVVPEHRDCHAARAAAGNGIVVFNQSTVLFAHDANLSAVGGSKS